MPNFTEAATLTTNQNLTTNPGAKAGNTAAFSNSSNFDETETDEERFRKNLQESQAYQVGVAIRNLLEQFNAKKLLNPLKLLYDTASSAYNSLPTIGLPTASAEAIPQKTPKKTPDPFTEKFKEIFEENKHKIKTQYQDDSQEHDQTLKTFKTALLKYAKEGDHNKKLATYFLQNIRKINIHKKNSAMRGGYDPLEHSIYLNTPIDVSCIDHELKHFEQHASRNFAKMEALNICKNNALKAKQELIKCFYKSSAKDCESMLAIARQYRYRPKISAEPSAENIQYINGKFKSPQYQAILSEYMTGEYNFVVETNENDSTEKLLYYKIGEKNFTPTQDQQDIFTAITSIHRAIADYTSHYGDAYDQDPKDKGATYKRSFSNWFLGIDYDRAFREFFTNIKELEAYLSTAAPEKVRNFLCPDLQNPENRMDFEFQKKVEEHSEFAAMRVPIAQNVRRRMEEQGANFPYETEILPPFQEEEEEEPDFLLKGSQEIYRKNRADHNRLLAEQKERNEL